MWVYYTSGGGLDRSFCGFQSESNITTVSAEAKLIPKPPALVESKKQKSCKELQIGTIKIFSKLGL